MHLEIQTALNAAIANPSFSGALPPLSEDGWRKLVVSHTSETAAENDRLEFLGDALMYATIGKLLYTQCPQGSPHLYTVLRSALHSNATFSKLAEKLDVFAVSKVVLNALTAQTFGEGSLVRPKPRLAIKKTADLFEAVIGAYYMERGFEALYEWVNEIYAPLIVIAKKSFSAT
ncbi:hypothetical protein EUX98_g163 [Antrodiella citrinella]|uniref:RNase III domain-containing protein n=1 Tax=Antrodiella citrinella TaxID=2447956 RepID=A0A4S4N734_9APHY|nr:hypothetical protein EUX98_g163 [Antrodiella citrinella]